MVLQKLVHTINANVVRGRSCENFFAQKFIIRKLLYMKISRSTVSVSLQPAAFLGKTSIVGYIHCIMNIFRYYEQPHQIACHIANNQECITKSV